MPRPSVQSGSRTRLVASASRQWRSQSAADARAQHGHTMFASSLVPRPRLEFLSFLGRFCSYFRPYRRLELEHFNHAFAMNLRAHRKVTVVLTANMHMLRSGEHTDLVILKIWIAILRSSISTPLCTFSAQFAIDNGTFGADNFQERLHWWGTASSC